ncbi:: Uma2 [Gemmataceae bacterium]|nr:: Uma2 [Gemmataceae bacterium]VTT99352.1 : Uma2 [Gemmataceae bacterium]
MDTVIVTNEQQIDIPAWVADFESFRRWLESEEFPEHGKVCFIHGKVWVDLSMEEFLSHNMLRTEIGRVLANLMKETKFGHFASEGMRYVHPETELSTEPDGMVISHAALRDGRVQLVGGKKGDQTQVVGSPDIFIEVVSRSSEVKDSEWAMSAYFDAGIAEYWVIDGRDEDDLRFDIFKRSKKEFTATRKQGGWVRSAVLERSFRLVLAGGERPEFTLEVR